MPSRVSPSLVEVFLLVEQPRQRLSHWSQALAPFDDPAAPPVVSVDAYYDPASNQAILGLRYDELTLGAERLGDVVEVALLAEIGTIQPAELSEDDRRRLIDDRLAICTTQVRDQRKVVGALGELVRRLRVPKPGTSPPALEATLLPRARRATAPKLRARVPTSESPLVLAKGTRNRRVTGPELPLAARAEPIDSGPARSQDRDDLPVEGPVAGTPDLALGTVRQPMIPPAEPGPEIAGGASSAPSNEGPVAERPRNEHAATAAARPVSMPPDPPRPSPNVIARADVHRAKTVPLWPDEAQQLVEAATEHGGAEPEPVSAPQMITARYLRGGRWVPLRIGALSLKGAALMAVALPRVDDRVDVALAYEQHRALVRGTVSKVSTVEEAEASGATMFSVAFELDDRSRRQLTALLTAARAANVTIQPAPPRSTRRYPVEWPVYLDTTRGEIRAEALDVSADGMFVKPDDPLTLDAYVTFSAAIDDSLPPVSGHARVIRNIAEAEAETSGLVPGYGLIILEMADPERERWSGFLSRVAKRAAKRVLIAASAARLFELETGLVAGGYATTGGTDPGAIAQLVNAEARPVDAALIDAAWLVTESSTLWVESVFTARGVPYVTVHGDARRARMAIDRLLAVV